MFFFWNFRYDFGIFELKKEQTGHPIFDDPENEDFYKIYAFFFHS